MRMHPSSIWVAVTQVYVQKEIHQGLFLRFMNLLIYNILYIYISQKEEMDCSTCESKESHDGREVEGGLPCPASSGF